MSVAQPYRVLVCGSRDWTDQKAIWQNLASVVIDHGQPTLIEGCAAGADRLSEEIARGLDWTNEHFPADWKRYGKGAGPVRNRRMLIEGKPDLVLAFQKNKSRGTQHMIDIATRAGIEVRVVSA